MKRVLSVIAITMPLIGSANFALAITAWPVAAISLHDGRAREIVAVGSDRAVTKIPAVIPGLSLPSHG